jgi:hypothetical protein
MRALHGRARDALLAVNPGADGILDALEKMPHRESLDA